MLVYAFQAQAPEHDAIRQWLERVVDETTVGLPEPVLSGFIRVSTSRHMFPSPAPASAAFAFANELRASSNAVILRPGPQHWDIFERLCVETNARGNVIPDAYLAALAIEADAEFITADRGFGRFPGLRWRHPLAEV